jgi:hypothetical protein
MNNLTTSAKLAKDGQFILLENGQYLSGFSIERFNYQISKDHSYQLPALIAWTLFHQILYFP